MDINEFTKWIIENPDLSKILFECTRTVTAQEYIEVLKPLKENGFDYAMGILFGKFNVDNAIKKAKISFYEQEAYKSEEEYSFEKACEIFAEKLHEQIKKEKFNKTQ